MFGDKYHSALAHYELGRAYSVVQSPCATEFLALSARAFRKLGARLDLARAEATLAALPPEAANEINGPETSDPHALSPLLTLRLSEAAAASRELLLRELVAVINQETRARKVLVAEPLEAGGLLRVVAAYGCANEEKENLIKSLTHAGTGRGADQWAISHDVALIQFEAANVLPATLLITPRSAAQLTGGGTLEALLRVCQMGLELCAYREKARAGGAGQKQSGHAGLCP
jgi:hypothetical protein